MEVSNVKSVPKGKGLAVFMGGGEGGAGGEGGLRSSKVARPSQIPLPSSFEAG